MGQSSIGQWAAPIFAFYNEKSAISEPPEVARSFTESSFGPLEQRLDTVFGWLWVFHHDDSAVFAARPSRAKKAVSYFRGSLT